MAFIRLLVRDCCGAQAEQRQALGNQLLQNNGVPPQGYATLDMPIISGWRYYDAVGSRNDAMVLDMVVSEYDGNFTDYAIAEVNSAILDSNNQLIGRIEIDVECRDVCNNIQSKGFWQIGGKALMPYRKPGTAYFTTDCGYTSSLSSMYSWGILEGETATIVAEGGRGSNRHFYSDGQKVKAQTSSGGSYPINGWNGGVAGLDPEIEFVNETFAVRMQQNGFRVKMEKNLAIDQLPQIEIKGIRQGLSFLYCTDGVACTWGMFIEVECNYCRGSMMGSEATQAIETNENLKKRSHDGSILTAGGDGWCPCEDAEEVTSSEDLNVLGSFDDSSTNYRNSWLLGGGLIAGIGAPMKSGNLFIKKADDSGRHVFANPPKNYTLEVGESQRIELPKEFLEDGEGNVITWGWRILPVPPIPSEGMDAMDSWGSGWGFGNTGPMVGFQNDDRKLWKVTKSRSSLTIEALAPTNYLPTVIQIYRKSGGLNVRSDAQYIAAPSLSEEHTISTSTSAGSGGSWPVREWQQQAIGGTSVIGTQYINVKRGFPIGPRSTSCSIFITANSFCPEANWTTTDLGDKLRVRITIPGTDKGQIRLFSPKENETYNVFADSNNYVKPDLQGDDFAEKDIELYKPRGAQAQKAPKDLIIGGTIFAIWSPYASNRIDNRHPYYNVTDLNRGLIDDGSEFHKVRVEDADGSTIGLVGPVHKPGNLSDDIEGDFSDKWQGLVEPLRGCMCTWGTVVKKEKGATVIAHEQKGEVKDLFLLAEDGGNRADQD